MDMDNAKLHTGVYSEKAKFIITQMLKSLSNGTYYVSRRDRMVGRSDKCVVVNEPDGEIVIKWIGSFWDCAFRKCTSIAKQYDWLSWRLKLVAFKEFERLNADHKHVNWKRDNTNVLSYYSCSDGTHDVTVADVYCLYDILKNRKKIEKKYSAKMLDEMRGTQRDPFLTQMEINRREEIENIKKEYENIMSKLRSERWQKADEAAAAVRKQYDTIIDEKKIEMEKKISELNTAFDATNMFAA